MKCEFEIFIQKAWRQLHKNATSNIEGNTPQSTNYTATSKTTKVKQTKTLLEKQGRAHKWCTPMYPPYMAE